LRLYLGTSLLKYSELQFRLLRSLAVPAFKSIVFCGVAVKNLENEQRLPLAT
jgi:hypothetical protein